MILLKWNNRGHQFDDLGNHFIDKKIVIYGAGNAGDAFYNQLARLQLLDYILGFVDHKYLEGMKYNGVPVFGIDKIFPKNSNVIIIVCIVDLNDEKQVLSRLEKAGYILGYDVFTSRDFSLYLNQVPLSVFALYRANKILLSSTCYIPSTICNLNCRDCLNFTPYIKKHTVRALGEACDDVDLLFNSLNYTERFQISGGEPLLYPELAELIKYVGNKYRNKIGTFELVLNGTVVPNDDVCENAHKYDMLFILDNYTKTIPDSMNKRKEILKRTEEYRIRILDNTVEDWFDLGVMKERKNEKSTTELEEFFDYCNNPWHFYENGLFYTCNFARFAAKAGVADDSENAMFSIKDKTRYSKKELLEFLLNYNEKGYIDFCKRCSGWAEINKDRVPVAVQLGKTEAMHEMDK